MLSKLDARGVSASYGYDVLNRMTSKSFSDGTGTTYVYDTTPTWGANLSNPIGRLVLATTGHAAMLFSYDDAGRVLTQWDCTPKNMIEQTGCWTVQAQYQLGGDLKQLTYPNGEAVTYTPDQAGRTLSAVDTGAGINYVTSAAYDAASELTGFVSGGNITNSFSYNNRLQPINMSAATSTATVFSIGYDFHLGVGNNGNVFGITNYKDTTRNQTFTYDSLNRLLSAQNAGTDCTVHLVDGNTKFWGNSYTYDAWGNLTQKTVTKCSAENLSIAVGTNNRITTAGYSYDLAGNMTNDGHGHALTYDAESRISQVNSGAATYIYDPHGNRVRKDVTGQPSTEYLFFGDKVLAETNITNGTWTNYIFFGRGRVARKDFAAATVSYYFSDHLNTASVITDSTGSIKSESDYYPWGGELQVANGDSNHYKFTGKERDETGLDYFGARYYENEIGRFVTSDNPFIDQHQSDPQSWNLYSYVRNNPVNRIDPDGRRCDKGSSDPKTGKLVIHCTTEAAKPREEKRSTTIPFPLVVGGSGAVATAAAGGLVVGAAYVAIRNITDTVVDNYADAEQAAAVESVIAVENVLLMSKNKDTLKVIHGLVAAAATELAKVTGGDPGDNHHKQEARAMLERVKKLAERLPGKLREAVLQGIRSLEGKVPGGL